jgi:addiction module RelE/StbE family toxin
MKVLFHKNFEKKFGKLNLKIKKLFYKRLELFFQDQFHHLLHNHALHGKYKGYRTINITGDIRAVFKIVGEQSIEFDDIDSHSNLYM